MDNSTGQLYACALISRNKYFLPYWTSKINPLFWPFKRSSLGVGGCRCEYRDSGVGGLDDKRSILSKLGSSCGPRTVNDPYTPSPCCETDYFGYVVLNLILSFVLKIQNYYHISLDYTM